MAKDTKPEPTKGEEKKPVTPKKIVKTEELKIRNDFAQSLFTMCVSSVHFNLSDTNKIEYTATQCLIAADIFLEAIADTES